MDKCVIESCFDEIKTSSDILFLKNERRKAFKRYVENETCTYYYILITKYLLSEGYSPIQIKRIIKRHVAVASYLIIKDKKADSFFCTIDVFDDFLFKAEKNNIDFFLKDYDEWYNFDEFSDLYISDDYEEIKNSISSITNEYEKITGKTNIYTLLNNVIDYFYFGCKFADLKYINHSDLLISYNMNDNDLKKFDFEIVDDSYKNYWISTQSFKEKDIKEKILGHIINIIFENDNLDYKDKMIIKPLYYYGIMLNEERKKLIQDSFSFFEVEARAQQAYINIDKIEKSFQFKYNGKNYIFTKEGIIEK